MTSNNHGRSAERLAPLHRFLSDEDNRTAFLDVASPPPDSIHLWLSNLVLLTGVPFEYLVPDEKMLPQESMRFFVVDENWVERLIDGALSVAGRTGVDQLITDALQNAFRQPVSDRVAASVRPGLLGTDPATNEPEALDWPLTGFLIRSIVVDHWKGIVIENTSKNDRSTSLSTLRLDRPAQGVLLGLYNGQLGSVTFKHPPESLHFGVDGQEDDPKTWNQYLRDLDTGKIYSPKKSVAVQFHDSTHQVIDVCATQQAIASTLDPTPKQFTSAELAIEMIESPKSVTFEMLYPTS